MTQDKGLLNKYIDGAEVDWSILKIVVLAIIGVSFAFLSGFFLNLFMSNGQWNFLAFSFACLLIFLTFFLLNVFFIKALWRINLIIFLESLAFLAGFYAIFVSSPMFFLIAGAAIFAVLTLANYAGWQELHNMIEIRFWRIAKLVLPKAVLGVAIFISVIYYAALEPTIVGGKEFFISQNNFEKLINPLAPLIEKFFPQMNFSSSVGDLIADLAKSQIESGFNSGLAGKIDKNAKSGLVNQISNDLKQRFSTYLGPSFNFNLKTGAALYGFLAEKYLGMEPKSKKAVAAIVAVTIFFIIVSLILPIRLLAASIAFIIYEILIAVGFAEVVLEGKSREIIILK
ncbi:hypothetical protein HZB06_03190 [Candidatus Wolfebacteria bacterium]|nr:hypothetical protein [Candidatus Wolfebacteria bacterium]